MNSQATPTPAFSVTGQSEEEVHLEPSESAKPSISHFSTRLELTPSGIPQRTAAADHELEFGFQAATLQDMSMVTAKHTMDIITEEGAESSCSLFIIANVELILNHRTGIVGSSFLRELPSLMSPSFSSSPSPLSPSLASRSSHSNPGSASSSSEDS